MDLPDIELSSADIEKLEQPVSLSEFQRNKLSIDHKKNWDRFYKRNGNRFFKSRYWARKEFQELFQPASGDYRCLLEVGCGCGDFILPFLSKDGPNDQSSDESHDTARPTGAKQTPQAFDSTRLTISEDFAILCCDISETAIELLKSQPAYRASTRKLDAFVADVSSTDGLHEVKKRLDGRLVDVVTLIYVLSAMDLDAMKRTVDNINQILKPGGLVLFRDYAIYDQAMLRFKPESKIADQFYSRQDGTRAYFFTKDSLVDLFGDRFLCQSIDYIKRVTLNRASQANYCRVFLQSKLIKKPDAHKEES